MKDEEIIERINALVEEEDALHNEGESLDPEGASRITSIETALDQCWDLLRQRRAKREFREDPDAARVRDPGTVEGYVQ